MLGMQSTLSMEKGDKAIRKRITSTVNLEKKQSQVSQLRKYAPQKQGKESAIATLSYPIKEKTLSFEEVYAHRIMGVRRTPIIFIL